MNPQIASSPPRVGFDVLLALFFMKHHGSLRL
jgi:hypothetical protein